MHTVGEDLVLRDATWAHNPSKNWCPVKEASANPYKILEPTEIDVEVGKALRASFFRNWKLHWGANYQHRANVRYLHVDFIPPTM